MNYYLFKLQFTTAVHFGSSDSALSLYTSDDHFCADTLFSALCHTANTLYGSSGAEELCVYAQAGKLCFSDSMPWCGEKYFLPKPYVISDHKTEVPAQLRKSIKKMKWIDISSFQAFADSVHGGDLYQPQQQKFGVYDEQTKVNLTGEESLPYQVGTYQFRPDCGLYILAGCENDEIAEYLQKLMNALGLSGIGGKVTSGYGRFSVIEMEDLAHAQEKPLQWLSCALKQNNDGRQMLLTSSLPEEEELDQCMEGASYQLIRRGGFANAASCTGSFQKKQTQYFLAAGSLLTKRFRGGLYRVSHTAEHPVYRYSVPVFLEVAL